MSLKKLSPQSKYPILNNRGFSILEVLITAAIVSVITAMVVFKYGSFNNSVLLKDQAYEMALNIREAQVFAVSVRGESGQFREDYGLYFTLAAPQQYVLFQDNGDVVENGKHRAYYDIGEGIGKPYAVDSRFQIKKICVNIVSSTNLCPATVDDISVTFKRPDFDAHFASVSGKNAGLSVNNARILLSGANSGTTDTRTIVISTTGQISIE